MYRYIMYIVMSVSIHKTSLDRNARGDHGIIIISICGYAPIDSSVSTADIITITIYCCTGDIENRSTKTVDTLYYIGSMLYECNNN